MTANWICVKCWQNKVLDLTQISIFQLFGSFYGPENLLNDQENNWQISWTEKENPLLQLQSSLRAWKRKDPDQGDLSSSELTRQKSQTCQINPSDFSKHLWLIFSFPSCVSLSCTEFFFFVFSVVGSNLSFDCWQFVSGSRRQTNEPWYSRINQTVLCKCVFFLVFFSRWALITQRKQQWRDKSTRFFAEQST